MGMGESNPPAPATHSYTDQVPQPRQRVRLMHIHQDVPVAPRMSQGPQNPHLGAPESGTTDSGCHVPWGAQEEEGAPATPCPPGHPCRSVASVELPGENPIHPDTQHRWPRLRQALGDKGPLLSSAGSGTGTGPAQQPRKAGRPRPRTVRGKRWGQEGGTEPHPSLSSSLVPPSPAPSLSFTILSPCTEF